MSLTSCAAVVLNPEAWGVVLKAVGTVGDALFSPKEPVRNKYRKAVFDIGEFRLIAFVVKPISTEDKSPIVICISSYWYGQEGSAGPNSAFFDAKQISLRVSEALKASPTGYAVGGSCFGPLSPSEFSGFDLERPIVTTRTATRTLFEDVMLRFDISQPKDEERIFLDLGSISLEKTEHMMPKLELAFS